MRSSPALGSWCGWFRPDGESWQKVATGDRSACLDALMDLAEPGEMLLLPAGQAPRPDHKGQFRRGLPEKAP